MLTAVTDDLRRAPLISSTTCLPRPWPNHKTCTEGTNRWTTDHARSTPPPDLHRPALRILRRLLAGIERPPALRLGDAILHELETTPSTRS